MFGGAGGFSGGPWHPDTARGATRRSSVCARMAGIMSRMTRPGANHCPARGISRNPGPFSAGPSASWRGTTRGATFSRPPAPRLDRARGGSSCRGRFPVVSRSARRLLRSALVLAVLATAAAADGLEPEAIVSPEDASPLEALAAREVRRYVYLRTAAAPADSARDRHSGDRRRTPRAIRAPGVGGRGTRRAPRRAQPRGAPAGRCESRRLRGPAGDRRGRCRHSLRGVSAGGAAGRRASTCMGT